MMNSAISAASNPDAGSVWTALSASLDASYSMVSSFHGQNAAEYAVIGAALLDQARDYADAVIALDGGAGNAAERAALQEN